MAEKLRWKGEETKRELNVFWSMCVFVCVYVTVCVGDCQLYWVSRHGEPR